ncbi:MAG: hypothetical protein MUC31_02970 [Bacteroidales bacterium]|nr:hypothetical protein [Bacteroidales bacterium]
MKRTLLLLSVAFFCLHQAPAQTYTYSDSWDDEGFNVESLDRQGLTLNYSIHGFTLDDIDIRGEAMKLVRLDHHFLPGDEGMPDLPGSGRYIALPQGATPVLHIKSVRKEVYKNVNVFTATPGLTYSWGNDKLLSLGVTFTSVGGIENSRNFVLTPSIQFSYYW